MLLRVGVMMKIGETLGERLCEVQKVESVLTSIAVLRVWILTLADSSRPYSFISVILPVSPSTP